MEVASLLIALMQYYVMSHVCNVLTENVTIDNAFPESLGVELREQSLTLIEILPDNTIYRVNI